MEFHGWTDQESIKAYIYISRLQSCLHDDDSKQALDGRLPQEAIKMLFERLIKGSTLMMITELSKLYIHFHFFLYDMMIWSLKDKWRERRCADEITVSWIFVMGRGQNDRRKQRSAFTKLIDI